MQVNEELSAENPEKQVALTILICNDPKTSNSWKFSPRQNFQENQDVFLTREISDFIENTERDFPTALLRSAY